TSRAGAPSGTAASAARSAPSGTSRQVQPARAIRCATSRAKRDAPTPRGPATRRTPTGRPSSHHARQDASSAVRPTNGTVRRAGVRSRAGEAGRQAVRRAARAPTCDDVCTDAAPGRVDDGATGSVNRTAAEIGYHTRRGPQPSYRATQPTLLLRQDGARQRRL